MARAALRFTLVYCALVLFCMLAGALMVAIESPHERAMRTTHDDSLYEFQSLIEKQLAGVLVHDTELS